ncbi:alpha-E domain-containing protein [Gammaproteobacteria bacterium]|nr:alpha-E domain-containing protein [Gammaproteobacteria bacterium]
MLSSVAERVYWLGRYLERIENSARLMDVYSSMLFDLPGTTDIGWGILLDITGERENYAAKEGRIDELPVLKYLIADQSNSSSIFSCMKLLRENARTTREVIPAEAWEQINDLYLDTKASIGSSMGRQARRNLYDTIISDCQRLGGLLSSCMSHNTAYTFIQIGRGIERADMTTRIVDVGSISLLPAFKQYGQVGHYMEPFENVVWMNILRCLSAYQAYRQHIHNRVKGAEVVRFLLQDEEFPRAVNYSLSALNRYLEQLPNHEEVQRAVLRVKRITCDAKVYSLLEKGLLDFIDELQISIADIHDELSKTWFGPVEVPEEIKAVVTSKVSKKQVTTKTVAKRSPTVEAKAKAKPKVKAKATTPAKAKPKAKSKAPAKAKAKTSPKAKAKSKARPKITGKTPAKKAARKK